MFQKNMKISLLIDFYGELLSEHKKEAVELYYNEDLSLAAIAEQMGISRQGVHDLVKKSEALLSGYEEKLGLAKRFSDAKTSLESLSSELVKFADTDDNAERAARLREIADGLSSVSI